MILPDWDITAIWSVLGWTLLHFLWQGAVIWLLAACILGALRGYGAGARYTAACGAMAACLMCFAATFIVLIKADDGSLSTAAMVHTVVPVERAVDPGVAMGRLAGGAQLAAWIWGIGVVLMGVRFGRNWLMGRRLRSQQIAPAELRWQRLLESLKVELGVGAGVKLLQSGLIEVPMVVGWLSPVILVPAAAFTALTPEQLRMVLAHELTHIRRHDHLVNMVQGVVEVILFFHPVTWWLSRQIRIEREHCCDSASIVSVGTPKSLVEALLKLESLRAPNPSTTIAATGGTFMQRIQRILTTSNNHPPTRSGWKALTACTAAALIGVAGLTTLTITGPALAQEMQRPAAAEEDASFTMSDVIIKVTMALESGDITPAQAAEYIIAAENALQAEIAFKAYEDQVMAAVRAGDLTREQAGADIKAYKADAWREASEALGMRLKTAVESGKMTREEAGEVYGVMMDKAGSGKTKQMTRKDYAEAEAKMKKMVAAGEITQEQMTIRLNEMREAIARQAPKLTRKDYAEAEAKMKKMVEAGEITQEQMEARLNRMQQMMAQQSPKMTRKDYVEAEAKMKKMVAAGEITQEQMTGRLNRMQKMMAQQAPGHGAARINQVDWDAVKARVEGAVASGAMTREQADEVYAGLKKRMAAVKGKASAESRTAISDECRELRIRLGEAVRSGEMTREQASEQWLAECGDER